jgi:hypothetical protein
VSVTDGFLSIGARDIKDNPLFSGIEVFTLPAAKGSATAEESPAASDQSATGFLEGTAHAPAWRGFSRRRAVDNTLAVAGTLLLATVSVLLVLRFRKPRRASVGPPSMPTLHEVDESVLSRPHSPNAAQPARPEPLTVMSPLHRRSTDRSRDSMS